MTNKESVILEHYVCYGSISETMRYFGVSKQKVLMLYAEYTDKTLMSKHAKSQIDNQYILDKYKSKNLTINDTSAGY